MREQPLRVIDVAPPFQPPREVGPTPACDITPERLGRLAADCLLDELDTWPKPGLVSPVDSGSHDDMDYDTFQRSIAALGPFYIELATAGSNGATLDTLRCIGQHAEEAMLSATAGANTHRGAIFALGLLCAAGGAAMTEDRSLGLPPELSGARIATIVSERWGDLIRRGPIPLRSHGSAAQRRFGAGGARAEAAGGFAHARYVGLPALRLGRSLAGDEEAARVHAFFALLATVEDTNLLHRAGAEGLRYARATATAFLAEGGVGQPRWLRRAMHIHDAFVRRRLSPGGSADLLATTLFLDRVDHSW